MEAGVWTDPEIEKILAENYVIISLYVDDKKNLLDSEIYFSENDQKIKKTIGAKWSEFQAKYFSNTGRCKPYKRINSEDKFSGCNLPGYRAERPGGNIFEKH